MRDLGIQLSIFAILVPIERFRLVLCDVTQEVILPSASSNFKVHKNRVVAATLE